MQFTKMHGTGNDFVLTRAQGDEHDWPALAERICDRHYGIGADGLILILPSSQADVRMRIFNPDGSEAEMCGNGIRCLVKEALDTGEGYASKGQITVETGAGILTAEAKGANGSVEAVRVSMGRPHFEPQAVPVATEAEPPIKDLPLLVGNHGLRLTCVSMGNPHAVHFVDHDVSEFPLEEVGPKVEHHRLFPQRVNFEVARVLDRNAMELRVWERGAGLTLACGTGACAAMVAAYINGDVDNIVDITLPGGPLRIEWDGAGEVYLTGPAQRVFSGEWLQ